MHKLNEASTWFHEELVVLLNEITPLACIHRYQTRPQIAPYALSFDLVVQILRHRFVEIDLRWQAIAEQVRVWPPYLIITTSSLPNLYIYTHPQVQRFSHHMDR